MPGSTAQPVDIDQLRRAKEQLQVAAERLNEAIDKMLKNKLETILLRSRTSLTKGVTGVYGMAQEARNRVEDAIMSQKLEVESRIQQNQERHKRYGRKKPPQ